MNTAANTTDFFFSLSKILLYTYHNNLEVCRYHTLYVLRSTVCTLGAFVPAGVI